MMILRPTESGRLASRVATDGGTTVDLVEVRWAVDEFIARNRELYDKASLVMISGCSKSGKIYSLSPVNGTGDLSFDRYSVKYVRNKAGYFIPVSEDIPAVEWNGTRFVIKSEPQRTNLVQQSSNFSHSYWAKNGLTVQQGIDSVFLNQAGVNLKNGFKLVETSISGTHNTGAAIYGVSAGSYVTIWGIFKKGERNRLLISDDNVGYNSQGIFDLDSGAVIGGGAAIKHIKHIVDGYYLCSATFIASSGCALRFYLHNGSSVSYQGDGVSGLYVCHAQVESAQDAGSPILTSGSTVTRQADTGTVQIPEGVIRIITTINGVDVTEDDPEQQTTYTLPEGEIERVVMLHKL